MRALRGFLVALVVFLVGTARAAYSGNPADNIPIECISPERIVKMLKHMEGETSDVIWSYTCLKNGSTVTFDQQAGVGTIYTVDESYLRYVFAEKLTGPYKGLILPPNGTQILDNTDSDCATQTTFQKLGLGKYTPGNGVPQGTGTMHEITTVTWHASGGVIQELGRNYYSAQEHNDAAVAFIRNYDRISKAYNMQRCWIRERFHTHLRFAFTNGYRQLKADGTPYTGAPASSGGTGGTTGTSSACTKADGTTSGNPYDCAPVDTSVNCSIIDIPCNFKKLFIPTKNLDDYRQSIERVASDKFPFNVVYMLNSLRDFKDIYYNSDGSDLEACRLSSSARIDIGTASIPVAGINMCDNGFATFLHEHVRRWLVWGLWFLAALVCIKIAVAK